MPFSRKEQLINLEKEVVYDLLIIGGGIVGSSTLAMASADGLNSILLEKNDFASGASSRSTKLLHGGIRYLPQLQFGLVRESLQEQEILKSLLGKLYKPLKLLAPIYKNNGFADMPKIFQNNFIAPKAFKLGLILYDLLGARKRDRKHKKISINETAELFPLLKRKSLKKSFIFGDAQTDDAKLVMTLLRNAVEEHKATAVNYMEIIDISTIENIYEEIDSISNEKMREKLLNSKDNALLSKQLVTILTDVKIDATINDFEKREMDSSKLEDIFKELEFSGLLKKIGSNESINIESVKREKSYSNLITIDQLTSFVSSVKENEWLSVDFETTSINPMVAEIVGFSFSMKKDTGVYVPIRFKDKKDNLFGDDDLQAAIDILKPILENPDIPKTGQNIKYDALIMKRYGINLDGIAFDTMIAAHLISPNSRSYKLDNLSISHLNYKMVPIKDLIGSGKNQITMDQVTLEDISFYAAEDADVVIELTEIFLKELKNQKLYNYFMAIEIDLLPVLIDMQFNGIFVDKDYLAIRSDEIGIKIDALHNEITKLADQDFNVNSSQQLAQILFDKLELPMIKKRSTAEAVLSELKHKHELPKLVLEYRKLFKLKNTYLDPIPTNINSISNRVHSSFNQTMTATGRLSSSSPNFQNIPIRTEDGKDVRKAIRAQSSDYQIFSADYSQVELRVMAHLSQDEALIQALNNGEDIHTFTAKNIFNIDKDEDVLPEMRRTAKIVNFGIMYGAGPFRLSQELDVPFGEAKKIKDAYFNKYKGIEDYIAKSKLLIKSEKSVQTLLGRKRAVWDSDSQNKIRRDAAERMAINMPIQGTAAEMIKIAMIKIYKDLKDNNLKSKLILQVHDELLLEVHKDEVDYISEMVLKNMKNAIELDVPIEIDCGFGPSWYEAH